MLICVKVLLTMLCLSVNPLSNLDVACEGGWRYNSEHTNLAGLLTDFAKTNDFTDAELIVNPVFRKFDNATLHQTNVITIAQTELNKVMGDGIPATSFAAGANPITDGLLGNINFQNSVYKHWPDARTTNGQHTWWHSDICKLAFFYVHSIFSKIQAGDSQ